MLVVLNGGHVRRSCVENTPALKSFVTVVQSKLLYKRAFIKVTERRAVEE